MLNYLSYVLFFLQIFSTQSFVYSKAKLIQPSLILPCLYKNDIDFAAKGAKLVKSVLTGSIIALSLQSDLNINAATPISGNALETSIVALESANSKSDVIQKMADLYEEAGAKTLLARTRYKYRIINVINEKRVKLNNEWDQALGYESNELKRRVDPYRTVDLKSYLSIAPIVGGICYLGALFVQRTLPELFLYAYPGAVFIFVIPIIFTVLAT